MQSDSLAIADFKPHARSRKTNGSAAFLGPVDGRSRPARRHRDLVRAFTDALGGRESLTTGQRVKVEQAAGLAVRAELLQAATARGEDVDNEDLVRVANTLRRELSDLGLDRKASKAPTPLRERLARRTA